MKVALLKQCCCYIKIGNKYLKTDEILNVQWSKQKHIIRQVQLSLKLIMS